jgi:hypothetical protein
MLGRFTTAVIQGTYIYILQMEDWMMMPPIVHLHDHCCNSLRLKQTGCTPLLLVASQLAFICMYDWSLIVLACNMITHYWSFGLPILCDHATTCTTSRTIACDHQQSIVWLFLKQSQICESPVKIVWTGRTLVICHWWHDFKTQKIQNEKTKSCRGSQPTLTFK